METLLEKAKKIKIEEEIAEEDVEDVVDEELLSILATQAVLTTLKFF